jgi:hypothetical protein
MDLGERDIMYNSYASENLGSYQVFDVGNTQSNLGLPVSLGIPFFQKKMLFESFKKIVFLCSTYYFDSKVSRKITWSTQK